MPRKSISVESYLVRINTKGLSRRIHQERNAADVLIDSSLDSPPIYKHKRVLVEFVAETNLPTDIGQFCICAYCMIDFDLDPKFYSEEWYRQENNRKSDSIYKVLLYNFKLSNHLHVIVWR